MVSLGCASKSQGLGVSGHRRLPWISESMFLITVGPQRQSVYAVKRAPQNIEGRLWASSSAWTFSCRQSCLWQQHQLFLDDTRIIYYFLVDWCCGYDHWSGSAHRVVYSQKQAGSPGSVGSHLQHKVILTKGVGTISPIEVGIS
jgi:hypothetical protein